MIYKSFKCLSLSALGLGCMRLPTVDGDDAHIDEAKTAEMVAYAMENGINYYDTAWGYHEGNSELVMGKVLSAYPRESFYLATKFPGYDLENMPKVKEIFEKQLEKLRVDYFDFYLFHCLTAGNIDEYLNPENGILDYLLEQKKNGRIRHLGFSVHAPLEVMKRFLDAYGEHIEFAQVQLNWVDWSLQDAKAKVEYLSSLGIPVWVMEPVRGGRLATLPQKYASRLTSLREDTSVPEFAFRFLQSIPEVTVTLSGMSNFEQLRENIEIYKTEKPLNEKEIGILFDIAADMTKKISVPCTACRYCTSHCPMELDIPMLLELYNNHKFSGTAYMRPKELDELDESKLPTACIGCRSCEAVCPQQIKVSEVLSDFGARMK